MTDYLKTAVWDFVVTVLAAIPLTYIALNGFYVSDALQNGPVPAIVAVLCCAALFVVARNKKNALIGGVVYGAVLLVAWIAAGAMTPGGAIFVDNESNYLIFAMVSTLIPTVCFLISRNRLGCALLFIAGVFFCALMQLLYQRFDILWTMLFVVAAIALIVFRNYQLSLRTASTVRGTAMLPGFAAALGIAVLAVGLGAGIWYGIIAPQEPGAVEIKLVTEYRALETKQVLGTSDIFQKPNTDMKSNETNDGTRTTDDIKESVNGIPWKATGEEDKPEDQSKDNAFVGIDLDSLQNSFDFQQNPMAMPLMLGILLLIAALVAAYFVGRRIWRQKRLEKMRALGPEAEFTGLFLFMLTRFKRLGVTVPNGQTVMEFGKSSSSVIEPYSRTADASFADLAATYCSVKYGKGKVAGETLEKMERFYSSFWKTCREQMGSLRYFFKSFKL